jgi:selenocysteine lyase/cysteine desulfurase
MPMDIDALRAQTPGCANRVHLNNAGAALMSQPTLEAMAAHLRREAEIGGYEAADEAREAIAATYAAIAELVGGASDEIALFDNATHAWNAAFYSVPLRPGDQILTGRAEIGSATWDGGKGFTWAPGARRFATWERSYVNVLGLRAAVRQALDLGLDAIGQRAVALGARLRDQLAELPRVTVHDLGRDRCAIVTAKIDGLPAERAAQALARAGVNVSTTVPEDNPLDTQDRGVHPLIRFSPHYYNTEAEIDRAAELVSSLAR